MIRIFQAFFGWMWLCYSPQGGGFADAPADSPVNIYSANRQTGQSNQSSVPVGQFSDVFYIQTVGVSTPISAPARDIPDGFVVDIAPLSSNSQSFSFGLFSPNAAITGNFAGAVIMAATQSNTPNTVRVRNLSDIWIAGIAGLVVVIKIRRG
jgi:hypothetical protein